MYAQGKSQDFFKKSHDFSVKVVGSTACIKTMGFEVREFQSCTCICICTMATHVPSSKVPTSVQGCAFIIVSPTSLERGCQREGETIACMCILKPKF